MELVIGGGTKMEKNTFLSLRLKVDVSTGCEVGDARKGSITQRSASISTSLFKAPSLKVNIFGGP